jgi:tetrahydromethanopterin S-methyltransferase subunit B
MTDLNQVESEIRDTEIETNEIVEETLEEAQAPKAKGKPDANATSEPESIASVDKAANATSKVAPPKPKTKAGMVNAIYSATSKMKKADLMAAYDKVCEGVALEDVAELDTNAELSAIVEGEATLSEEFKEKTAIIFETAVKTKLSEEVTRLEEQYAEELAEEVETIKTDLVGKVDSYLNYVVETWMEENKVAIETGLRTEIAEGFMNGMRDLFVESYVEVPETKVDLVDELAEQVSELEEKLNSTTGDAISLAEELETYKRNTIIAEASRGLADTQAEKLTELLNSVDFENEETFVTKVNTVKESYFSKEIPEQLEESVSTLTEDTEQEEVEVSSSMEVYLNALRKTSKK